MRGILKPLTWILIPLVTLALGFGVVTLFVNFGKGMQSDDTAGPRAADARGADVPAPDQAVSDDATSDNPYADRFRLAGFELTDQDGSTVGEELFDGQVTALAFFFTNCPGPCPLMTQTMRSIQDRTRETGLRFASISVDGTRDTPAVLREYAQRNGADASRWRFLTGEPALVEQLALDSLNYQIREQPEFMVTRGDGTQMANILHPTRLLLLGPDRRMIGIYAYNDDDAIERLIADARAALRAVPNPAD